MDALIFDLALHRLSKNVISKLQELADPQKFVKVGEDHPALHFERMYENGEISRLEYLMLHSRVILNDFCYMMEEKIGHGVVCCFTFYSKERHKLFFGAGGNYPKLLRKLYHNNPPTVCLETDLHYSDNELLIINNLDQWVEVGDWEDYVPAYRKTKVRSFISKRLRKNDFTFGTFETCFPYENGPTSEIAKLIRKEVQPIKEELYHIRNEMVQILDMMPEALLLTEEKALSNYY